MSYSWFLDVGRSPGSLAFRTPPADADTFLNAAAAELWLS